MKKLITTFEGGHDLRLDDIGFLQEAYQEALDAILSSDFLKAGIPIPDNPFVLKGCVQTGNTFTAGAIFWQGEIYLVDAQSITGSGTLYWERIITYNPISVTYEDGQVRQVHQIRKLRPTYTNPGVVNGFTNAVLQRYINPSSSCIGEIVQFPKHITPPSLYYLPCHYSSEDLLHKPEYTKLRNILPKKTTYASIILLDENGGNGNQIWGAVLDNYDLFRPMAFRNGHELGLTSNQYWYEVRPYLGVGPDVLYFINTNSVASLNLEGPLFNILIPTIPDTLLTRYYIKAN